MIESHRTNRYVEVILEVVSIVHHYSNFQLFHSRRVFCTA